MGWLRQTSIGRKVFQGITGLLLILFLCFHLVMNIALVFSYDVYNYIATDILGANWWAVAGSVVIAAIVFFHVVWAIILTVRNVKARGINRYAVKSKTKTTWSSKNMAVLGIVIFAFLVIHLYQFWYNMQFKEVLNIEGACEDPAQLVVQTLSKTWVFIVYLVAFIALWFHMTHGWWSALHSIGWDNNKWNRRLHIIGYVISTIICLGFAFVAVSVYTGHVNMLNV